MKCNVADYAFTPTQVAALMTDIPAAFQHQPHCRRLGHARAGIHRQHRRNRHRHRRADLQQGQRTGVADNRGQRRLSGTPGFMTWARNMFTARVTDAAGASAFTVVSLILPNIFNAGTGTPTAAATGATRPKWSGGISCRRRGLHRRLQHGEYFREPDGDVGRFA